MPLTPCTSDGESGWKWGNAGKCYVGPGAKRKAIMQGLAEGGGKLDSEPTAKAEVTNIQDARLARIRKRARV